MFANINAVTARGYAQSKITICCYEETQSFLRNETAGILNLERFHNQPYAKEERDFHHFYFAYFYLYLVIIVE